MKKSKYTLLMERIEQNYEEFIENTLKLEKENIFEYASTITAVGEVYFFMTTHDWADEYKSEYLLEIENPLIFLSDKWEKLSENRSEDLDEMLTQLIKDKKEEEIEKMFSEMFDEYGVETVLEVLEIYRIGILFEMLSI